MAGQINFKANDETKLKLAWLSEITDDNTSGIIRKLIDAEYEVQKAKHQYNQDFISWLKANR